MVCLTFRAFRLNKVKALRRYRSYRSDDSFQKEGEKSISIDQGGDGGIEISSLIDVFPGQYYIRVSNTKDYTEPITGEYTLEIEYTPKLIDPNEPNDKSYQATFAAMNSVYEGLFNTNDDVDWFEFEWVKMVWHKCG